MQSEELPQGYIFENAYHKIKEIVNESDQNIEQSIQICINYLKSLISPNLELINFHSYSKNNLAQEFTEKGEFYYIKVILQSYKIIYKDNPELFDEFITNENNDNKTIFEISILLNTESMIYIDIIEYLYQYLALNEKVIYKIFSKRTNIFHLCAIENLKFPIIFYFERLKKYFPKNNILNIKNKAGIAPIHYAAYYSNKKIVDILIDFEVDINIKDLNGDTPLHYGINSGNYVLVKKLIVCGAEKNTKNNKGISPKDICIQNNYINMGRLFNGFFCQVHSIKNKEKDVFFLFSIIISIFIKFYIIFLYNKFKLKDNLNKKSLVQYSFIIDLITLIITLFFKYFGKKLYLVSDNYKKKFKGYMSNFIKNYPEDDNKLSHICFICKHVKNSQMKHCIICKECVEKWDHHCFWLHICINEYSMKYFILFLFFLSSMIILDMIIIYQFNLFSSIVFNNQYYLKYFISLSVASLEGIFFVCLIGILPQLIIEFYYKYIKKKENPISLAEYNQQKLIEQV